MYSKQYSKIGDLKNIQYIMYCTQYSKMGDFKHQKDLVVSSLRWKITTAQFTEVDDSLLTSHGSFSRQIETIYIGILRSVSSFSLSLGAFLIFLSSPCHYVF